MPLRSVLGKSIHDQWRAVLAWSAFAALLPGLYVALYPTLGTGSMMQMMQQFIDQMPEAFKAFFASTGLDMTSAEGFLNIELFGFVGPLLLLAVGIALGASATAAEEEAGTADLLLANPIRRSRVVVEKTAAMVLWTVVVAVAIWTGVALAALGFAVELRLDHVAGALVSLALLGIAYGGVALVVGALVARRMTAIAVATMLALVAYFVNTLAPLIPGMTGWRVLSPFYWYIGNDPLRHGLEPAHALALVAVAIGCVVAAAVIWERRDIRG
jgi:ABC-2 type transport system permease protein